MIIAVTTPTGNVGSKVAHCLIESGARVVLLTRDASKLQHYVEKGAEVRQGSLDDPRFVTEATAGVDTLFWVTPTNPVADDPRRFQKLCGIAAAQAVLVNNIQRVVNLSSIGAQLPGGTGPIAGLHLVEELLNMAAANVVHLRPGWFFENLFWQLEEIRDSSSIFMTLTENRLIPMIATKDIAAIACDLLLDDAWQGQHVRGLHGPMDLTLPQAAEQVSQGLGRIIRYIRVTDDETRRFMRDEGMSDAVINDLLEMDQAISAGRIVPAEARTAQTTTPTTLETFAREVLAPLLHAPVDTVVG